MEFDGRGLKCPLAFVKAKQYLIKHKTKVFLFDDDISLYNLTQYLDKQQIVFSIQTFSQYSRLTITTENN